MTPARDSRFEGRRRLSLDEQPRLEHWCVLRELQWTNGLLRSGGARGACKAAKLFDLYERLYFGAFGPIRASLSR
jgi:hypothetical protein